MSRLRGEVDARLAEGGEDAARAWLAEARGLPAAAADQLAGYLATARAALGTLPTQERLVLERFFDEAGDMHLVLHSPYGSRLNRAWGLALRKRFCRKFNFELQAAALEDSIVLSLGPSHSFPLDEVWHYLSRARVREVLTQALLDAPMFALRWRWNVSVALAVPRTRNGRRRPPQLQRQDAEDLLSVVFPDQLACAENLAGAREIPAHPLVTQTLADCLEEAMDLAGLERLLTRLEGGELVVDARDLARPSPLAEEVVNARPYAFLDDGAQEERRTLSVRSGGALDPAEAAATARYAPAIVQRVREEAWPGPRDADELHDALVLCGFLTATEGRAWRPWFRALAEARRATAVALADGETLWVAAERLAELQRLHPSASPEPPIAALGPVPEDGDAALLELLRSRFRAAGRLHRRRRRAPVVRTAAAGADAPLCPGAPARRDRAGQRARLPAVPARLAWPGRAAGGRGGPGRGGGRAGGLRGGGGGLGAGGAAGPGGRLCTAPARPAARQRTLRVAAPGAAATLGQRRSASRRAAAQHPHRPGGARGPGPLAPRRQRGGT